MKYICIETQYLVITNKYNYLYYCYYFYHLVSYLCEKILCVVFCIRCHDCKKEITVTSSKKLQSAIDLISSVKLLPTSKQKMNELPIQGCPSEAEAQFDQFVSG